MVRTGFIGKPNGIVLTHMFFFSSVEDVRVPSSLAYHLADVYLEELDKAFAKPPIPDPLPAPLSTLSHPFFAVLARTPTNATLRRVQNAFLEPLLSALTIKADPDSDEDEDGERNRKRPKLSESQYENLLQNSCTDSPEEGAIGKGMLKKTILKQTFDIASEESTRDANRRKLYAIVKSHADDDDEDGS